MDRLNQLRGAAGSSSDSTLDTTSPPSEAFITANESSSKYFSLSEVDSTFDISPIKDVSLASASSDPERTITGADELISNLSPISKKSDILDGYKIGKQIEAANILSGGVDIFDDNDNSYDGDELVIDDNVEIDEKSNPELKQSDSIDFKAEDNLTESTLMDTDTDIASKDTEVVLQIDGKNVDAIDIGNGLYLYRKEGQEELAAVQIIDDDQQPSFKFLKVRENSEGNLEVYEEIEIEVPKEVPAKEGKSLDKTTSHVPIKDINKVINDQSSNKVVDRNNKTPQKETTVPANDEENEVNDVSESKSEVNLNGKMMKFSESRKSPVIGTFTPMTYHSTPNKEGIPLTKTMVNMHLQPSRHSDNVKKTIEVHTDSCKQKYNEASGKLKDFGEDAKETELSATDTEEFSTPIKDSENLEADVLENEPKKTDMPEEETNEEDKNAVLTEVAEEPTKMPITSDKITKNTKLLEENISKQESESPLKMDIICGDDASTSHALVTIEKNNDTTKSMVINLPTAIVEASTQDDSKKPKDVESTMLQNEPLETDEMKIINESEIQDNLKCASVTMSKTEADITVANPQEKPVILPEIIKQIPKETHLKKEVIDRSDKNKSEDKIEIIDTKCSKVTEINSSIVKNVTTEVLKNNIEKPQLQEESYKPSDDAQGKPIADKKEFDKIGEKNADDIIEIVDDSFVETKKESMEKLEKELDEGVVQKSSPSDTESGKQETPEIKEQMEIKSKSAKTMSELAVKQPKSITSTCVQEEISEVLVEDKPAEQIAESQQTPEGNLSTVESKGNDEKTIDTKQPNSVDVTQTCKLDDHKEINKVPIEKPLTSEVPKVQVHINPPKIIPKPNIIENVVSPDKTEEIRIAPATIDSKLSIANNNKETALKTESNKSAPSAKMEITTKKITNSEQVKKQLVDNKKEVSNVTTNVEPKPTNNNTAVPFGKWTEANRQEFLNKIKESKVPVNNSNSSNSKPIKNSNDLNRRDVLKKIDSQRQSSNAASKAQEANKMKIKNETVFTNKPVTVVKTSVAQNVNQGSKIPVKEEAPESKSKPVEKPHVKKVAKQEVPSHVSVVPPTITTSIDSSINKKETVQRKGVNAQDLIDKTVEELINKGCFSKYNSNEAKSNSIKDRNKQSSVDTYTSQSAPVQPTSLDAIEMKMNELHGIPFIERPPHELPRPQNSPFNNYNKGEKERPQETKPTKIPNLLPYSNKNPTKLVKENVVDFDSEEEIIEHEPVTGDIEIVKKALPSSLPLKDKLVPIDTPKPSAEASKKETIITETDFDKFARRNSVTYENCITVSYDGKEQHNVIQTVVEKDAVKNYSKNDVSAETKPKSVHKPQSVRQTTQSVKVLPATKIAAGSEDPSNKNYQSKLQIAYQSALTAKRHMESPITVLEDKPVKVVFMDTNPEFIANKLNVQGQNLSPAKKLELDLETVTTNDSLDSEITDTVDDNKLQDEFKPKTKHQRKQVLTPVEEPELELIEPSDLGIEVSPKKKRKTEDFRTDKNSKHVVHKKSYLLGRSVPVEDKTVKPVEMPKNPVKETIHRHDDVSNKDTVTALDNLVKAAELVENQSENINKSTEVNPDSQPTTPVKRGRGRPRKYPLPEGTVDKAKAPSPQKKPRLIDAKPNKRDTTTEEEESSDDEIVKENWTMGKINENIVCPICNKLFRSENVVFKHVKHCTGPSPNRSDTDKRSARRVRQSQESDSKSEDMDIDEDIAKDIKKYTPKKRRSKDSSARSDSDKEDNVIVIEDTPVKDKSEKDDDRKHHESRKLLKTNIQNRIVNNLVCEFCGKTFRQLSYLVSHKLQHKKEEAKKSEKDVQISKSVFSCEICKKEFRKLHHLVQHRLIHNPQPVSSRLSRKSSSDQEEVKSEKEDTTKQSEDPSAGFRCEPCDKSFRKLHHLVEHRETHDGINRQKGTSTVQAVVEKPTPSPQCEICKKTFRKLHHLMEHKEQHLDTSSEKSDDKSVKSSLSTRDIIHECPLCYMVFPNEHSLNKHTVICQRKKRQSKQPKPVKEEEVDTIDTDDNAKSDENKSEDNDEPEIIAEEVKIIILENDEEKEKPDLLVEKKDDVIKIIENLPLAEIKEKAITQQDSLKDNSGTKISITKNLTTKPEITEVVMKVEEKEIEKAPEVPKKKTPMKGKVASSMSKRQKLSVSAPADTNNVSSVETSDDDEVRYMLNPDFKVDETSEGKIFLKVRAKKRNSLQIERPNSKDLIKRRTSLQHPPKIPRLKPKPNEPKAAASVPKNVVKTPKLEPVPSTDSDDSDVKYSFPKATPEKTSLRERPSREIERKPQRKSLIEKRKTLSGIAKRKSLGKTPAMRHKETASPPKQIKRRTLEVEHRCDCGQLFSSAALLARHTTLAHTPPRIRRRRSPPPATTTITKPAPRKSSDKPTHTAAARKSSVRSDTSASNAKPAVSTRKSNVKNDVKSSPDKRKSIKPTEKVELKKPSVTNVKSKRGVSTRTATVPEKTKKSQKSKI